MKKSIVILFILLVFIMLIDSVMNLPIIIHNLIYGVMAIIAIAFLLSNKEYNGLNDIFKRKNDN